MNRQTVVVIALVVITVMNLVSFALMGIDKLRARRGAWRISEKALFLRTDCFGGLGGVLCIIAPPLTLMVSPTIKSAMGVHRAKMVSATRSGFIARGTS